jgi:hypothetical protein
MTTATIFSTASENQNAAGQPFVPVNTVVNTGSPINHWVWQLTVTPSTGWAKAAVRGSLGGTDYVSVGEVFVAPNSGGTVKVGAHSPPADRQYFTGTLLEVGPPGTTAALTMTY